MDFLKEKSIILFNKSFLQSRGEEGVLSQAVAFGIALGKIERRADFPHSKEKVIINEGVACVAFCVLI